VIPVAARRAGCGRCSSETTNVHAQDGAAEDAPQARAWKQAIALFAEDLVRRDAAPRTRRAYELDALQFARWAADSGLAPTQVGPRAVRRYVAGLTERGLAPASSARKLAALRALFASQREHALIGENPAELVSARLLDGIPASTPLQLRDRALFELAYGCGLRAEELVTLTPADVDHDAEQL